MPVDGRMYVATFTATASPTAAFDFFEVTVADDKPVVIHAIYIGQTTELGDAAEEQLAVEIQRGGTAMTTGSGGTTAAAPGALGPGGAAAGCTFEAMNTTRATFTAGEVKHRDAFNVRTGWVYLPTPETRITVSQANGGFSVACVTAPADAITFTGSMVLEELG